MLFFNHQIGPCLDFTSNWMKETVKSYRWELYPLTRLRSDISEGCGAKLRFCHFSIWLSIWSSGIHLAFCLVGSFHFRTGPIRNFSFKPKCQIQGTSNYECRCRCCQQPLPPIFNFVFLSSTVFFLTGQKSSIMQIRWWHHLVTTSDYYFPCWIGNTIFILDLNLLKYCFIFVCFVFSHSKLWTPDLRQHTKSQLWIPIPKTSVSICVVVVTGWAVRSGPQCQGNPTCLLLSSSSTRVELFTQIVSVFRFGILTHQTTKIKL